MTAARIAWVAVAILFTTALCLGALCALSFWLPPTLSMFWICSAALTGGTAIVFFAAVGRGPSDWIVAHHLDNELETHEIFASAVAASAHADEPARRSLRALAAVAAAKIQASDVPVNGPSMNLAAAAVLLLMAALASCALVPTHVAKSPAEASNPAVARVDSPTSHFEQPGDASDHVATTSESLSTAVRERQEEMQSAKPVTDIQATVSPDSNLIEQGRDAAGSANNQTETSTRVELAFAKPQTSSTAAAGEGVLESAGGASQAIGRAGEGRKAIGNGVVNRLPLARDLPIAADASGRSLSASPSRGGNWSIPDRHRALVRAYFDVEASAETIQPHESGPHP